MEYTHSHKTVCTSLGCIKKDACNVIVIVFSFAILNENNYAMPSGEKSVDIFHLPIKLIKIRNLNWMIMNCVSAKYRKNIEINFNVRKNYIYAIGLWMFAKCVAIITLLVYTHNTAATTKSIGMFGYIFQFSLDTKCFLVCMVASAQRPKFIFLHVDACETISPWRRQPKKEFYSP